MCRIGFHSCVLQNQELSKRDLLEPCKLCRLSEEKTLKGWSWLFLTVSSACSLLVPPVYPCSDKNKTPTFSQKAEAFLFALGYRSSHPWQVKLVTSSLWKCSMNFVVIPLDTIKMLHLFFFFTKSVLHVNAITTAFPSTFKV